MQYDASKGSCVCHVWYATIQAAPNNNSAASCSIVPQGVVRPLQIPGHPPRSSFLLAYDRLTNAANHAAMALPALQPELYRLDMSLTPRLSSTLQLLFKLWVCAPAYAVLWLHLGSATPEE
mmetsp:Transcript_30972/g.68636  ORF Transcript_30972/g.68636 Transcript_30972/m.68636 type:complete len:121 (+) Transcript_30972:283-645(+)|eukprot:CAMPEP_0202911406 /NCGR_PEP_ID=MMETSP1392-20130828/54899_1 /ASSEMBLY_ACC=CAM_ASM_000868 /TAXON_ID=225041 /ORGANISM="Chlamydomonas chlamydogama, Strain SAG 11-48b" /LENGTH=120 /DNA_ID=CAMNT_0049601893 /DNA_START=279 /DNA_END=641 /DNA_ORIENTATION=+